jgi:hypothetical protein
MFSDRCLTAILFLATTAATIILCIGTPVPLSLDGPSHFYNSVAMRKVFANDPLYTAHFTIGSPLIPNWMASVLAMAISLPGTGPWSIAVMNVCISALLVASLYYAYRVATKATAENIPQRTWYSVTVIVAIAPNVFLIMGFWDFLISVALCIAAASALHDQGLTYRRTIAFSLVILGYWAHPVPVVLSGIIPVTTFVRAALGGCDAGPKKAWYLKNAFLTDILPWCIPVLLVAGYGVIIAKDGARFETAAFKTQVVGRVFGRVFGFFTSEALRHISPSGTVTALFIMYFALIAFGTAASFGAKGLAGRLTDLAWISLILYLLVPNELGRGAFIPERVLWIAVVAGSIGAISGALASNIFYLRWCAILAATVSVVLAAEFALVSRRMQPAINEFRAALENVPKRSEVLFVGYEKTPKCGRWPVLDIASPERHWAALEMIPRELILLNDYEPRSGHFPVRYRDRRFSSISDFVRGRDAIWKRALDSAPGIYVISWGVPSGHSASWCDTGVDPPLKDILQQHYSLKYESSNYSQIQVWEGH